MIMGTAVLVSNRDRSGNPTLSAPIREAARLVQRRAVRLLALCFAVLPLLLGCAAVEVRVVDGTATAETSQEHTSGEGEAGAAQNGGEAGADEVGGVDPLIEGGLTTAVAYLVLLAEACGAVVIGVGVLRAAGQFLRALLSSGGDRWKDELRIRLGRSLAVGLEFGLAADILKTAVAPTWEIIAELAAIIVLRTLLNYFLERELHQIESRQGREV